MDLRDEKGLISAKHRREYDVTVGGEIDTPNLDRLAHEMHDDEMRLLHVGRVVAVHDERLVALRCADAAALAEQQEMFTVSLAAGPYQQAPFGYQVKCLAALRQAYGALAPVERERARATLQQTGCLEYF